jgi:hypothetical protein
MVLALGSSSPMRRPRKFLMLVPVEDLLLRGVVGEAVVFLQNEDFEHEDGIERGLATFAPIAAGIAGEFLQQGAETFPVNELAQLEDAGGFGGDCLLVLDGGE